MLKGFLDSVGNPVLKVARGGYDGRGVLFPQSRVETLSMIDELTATSSVVVEERLNLRGELALVVVRGVHGEYASYPLVSSVQSKGMCVEVRYPAGVDAATQLEANRLGRKIANLVGAVGVLAVEFFVSDRGLVVNEIALRPHNTGHWTIEGARTSQFANHLLAVSGRALGSTDPIVPIRSWPRPSWSTWSAPTNRGPSSARSRSPTRTSTTTASRGVRAANSDTSPWWATTRTRCT
jgi:5-(carboxyamino)imidazole ribonucleotide synthase